jgi:Ca2+-binding RTX toxin-like protein
VHNYTGPYGVAPVYADNFNLFGTNDDAGVVGFTPGPKDIIPAAGVMLADILDPLDENGGPTATHALAFGSPASDASPVDKDCALTGQRGVLRPQGSACDIGAFEVAIEAKPFASPTPTGGCTVNGVPNQLCIGTAGKDTVVGTTGNDVIAGLISRDVILGRDGDDRIFGGRGNDELIGNRGNDLIAGGEGDDTLLGNEGSDTLLGEAGKDEIKGGTGDDFLDGGPGRDELEGQQGTDTCLNGEQVSGCP